MTTFKFADNQAETSPAPAVPEAAAQPAVLSAPAVAMVPWQDTDEFKEAARSIAQEAATQAAETVTRALVSAPLPQLGAQTQSPFPLYAFDQPLTFQTPHSPKQHPKSPVSVDTLRLLADNYDILRACIQHLKREVAAVPIAIAPKDPKDQSPTTRRQMKIANDFIQGFGGLGGYGERRQHFERKVFEDLLVVGAAAMYQDVSLDGDVLQVIPIDAATIRPFVDGYGWGSMEDDTKAYEQWVQGVLCAEFTHRQMRYDGLHPTSYSPYFKSPIEYILAPINAALRADAWNLSWLTTGNTPSDIIALPADWKPEQIIAWAKNWDAQMKGSTEKRQQTKFVPGGSQKVGNPSRKDSDFQEFEMWLARRTMSVMGVSPTAIGHEGTQYKVSQEGAAASTSIFGAGELLDWRKETYDDLWARKGLNRIETVNVLQREEDADKRATRNVSLVTGGIKTINEARADEGMDPLEGGDTLLISMSLIPIEMALQPRTTEADPAGDDPAAQGPEVDELEDPAKPGEEDPEKNSDPVDKAERAAALRTWERKALARLKSGKPAACSFESPHLTRTDIELVRSCLAGQTGRDGVRGTFAFARAAEVDLYAQIQAVPTGAAESVYDALYAKLRDRIAQDIAQPFKDFALGLTDKQAAGERAFDACADAHAHAAHLGAKKAGSGRELGDYERAIGERVAEEQGAYLDNFQAAVDAGKYTKDDGTIDEDAIERRGEYWDRRLRGTANEAWANNVDEEIWWDTNANESCGTCADIASRSPYKPNELPTYPGDGATECNIGCLCTLRTASGKTGF